MRTKALWRSILVLVLCCSLVLNVFAATTTETVENEDGSITVTVTEETTTTEDGQTTVVTDVTSTTTEGEQVKREESSSTTVVTDENGDFVSEEGYQKSSWTEEDTGDAAGQLEISVALTPGETTTGTVTSTTTTDNVTENADDVITDTTTITTTERTATATTSDVTVEATGNDGVIMEGMIPVYDESKEGIYFDNYDPHSYVESRFDEVTYEDECGNEITKWIPRFVRDDSQMTEELQPYYDYDESTGLWTPKAVAGKSNYTDAANWEFVFAEDGEYATAGQAVANDSNDPTQQFILYDQDGNRFCAYCMDVLTGTYYNYKYVLENLDDAAYFADNEESRSHVRAIVKNGYWGTESGLGSLDKLQSDLIAAIESGELDALIPEGGSRQDLLTLAQNINEGEALCATQGAIWSFGRSENRYQGFTSSDDDAEARITLIYDYLRTLTEETTETVFIDEDSYLAENGLSLVIGDKVVGAEVNADDQDDNDLYNVALSFKLQVTIDEEQDDLVVKIIDSNGNVVRQVRLAGDDTETQYGKIVADENGVYTITGLQLAENVPATYSLQLEGIQQLVEGVYIYKGINGYDNTQTLVGLAAGAREVGVSTTFTIEFSVDEDNQVVAERVWYAEADPVTPELPGGDNMGDLPGGNNQWPDAPNGNIQQGDDLEEIEEEEVPLADVPNTGDASILFTVLAILSACGLAVLAVTKKREQN